MYVWFFGWFGLFWFEVVKDNGIKMMGFEMFVFLYVKLLIICDSGFKGLFIFLDWGMYLFV